MEIKMKKAQVSPSERPAKRIRINAPRTNEQGDRRDSADDVEEQGYRIGSLGNACTLVKEKLKELIEKHKELRRCLLLERNFSKPKYTQKQ